MGSELSCTAGKTTRGGGDNAVLVLFEGKMIKNALVVAVVLEERKLNFRVG